VRSSAIWYCNRASKATVFSIQRILEISITPEQSSEISQREAPAWQPLASPVFRLFWIASLASNVGTWVHEVGSGWLMSVLDDSPAMVSAVRVAMSIPILLLAIPAGALADRVDRRRLLIGVQCVLMTTTAVLSLLTFTQWITPASLLTLTIIMGLGMVVHVPTWQASLPELVPREQIPQAVALGSISFNLARSVGPALGGILIATYGTWVAFAVNSLSFAMVVFALFRWKREPVEISRAESYHASIVSGVSRILRDSVMRNVLVRVVLFVLPASALWSLMPLIAREQLDWDSRGYGYLVGAIGVGAVSAAFVLPRIRRIIGLDQTIFVSMCVFASGLAVTSISSNRVAAMLAMFSMGVGWMMTLTTLNSTAQVTLPNSVRARGMACYLSAMAAGMALGAWSWGLVASAYSPAIAELLAAALLPIHAIIGLALPIDAPKHGRRTVPSLSKSTESV
jgi:predicted MFS family arabinose efflux permease